MVIDFETLYGLPREISRAMDDFGGELSMNRRRIAYPLVNISENKEKYKVDFNIPGVDKNDIDINIMKNSLIIKGKRTSREGRYYRRERLNGDFQRIITLGYAVDRDKATASYNDGILTVEIPKADSDIPKKIAIEA